MPGELDSRYVRARSELLDALDALQPHHAGLTLVGAQAVYMRSGPGDLVVVPFTEDGDLAVHPALLANEPLLDSAMISAGFSPGEHPGSWVSADQVVVDLLVPASLAGPGETRGARIPPHGKRAARRTIGLEAALVDRTLEDIAAFGAGDGRLHRIGVAGPAALIVAKAHKLGERAAGAPSRVVSKDALDIYRLLLAYDAEPLAESFTRLRSNGLSGSATDDALAYLERLFDESRPVGPELIADALAPGEDRSEVIAASIGLVRRLVGAVRTRA